MEAIIIKHISPAEKELTSNLPIIAKIAVTNTGRKTDIRTPHFFMFGGRPAGLSHRRFPADA